jgi:membrane fusion protein, heavy metal efflux system
MRDHRKSIACASGALAVALLAGCGTKTTPSAHASTSARNPLEIAVRPDLMEQVKVGTVPMSAVSMRLTLPAHVELDETRLARISAPMAGRIMELEVVEGQQVTRGQVLATLHSTELAAAQAAFLKAHTQKQLAERAVARAKQLLEAGVIGSAELQRREAEMEQAATETAADRVQLHVLGMSDDAVAKLETTRTVNSTTQILATIDGRVMDRKVTIGQVVQAAEIVCVVADLSNVWLVADVPEQNAGNIRAGKAVEAELPAFPGIKIAGTLAYVGAVVNKDTRTVRARMNLNNADRRYKPDMLATMTLIDGAEQRRVVPFSAIVREANEPHVLVETGQNKFTLRKITLGGETSQGHVLETGLNSGEKIILEGAFHINNERRRLAMGAEN